MTILKIIQWNDNIKNRPLQWNDNIKNCPLQWNGNIKGRPLLKRQYETVQRAQCDISLETPRLMRLNLLLFFVSFKFPTFWQIYVNRKMSIFSVGWPVELLISL